VRLRVSLAVLGVWLGCLAPQAWAQAAERGTRWLPLVLHVAELDGRPVADENFLRERVARANEIYAPYRVGFVVQRRLPLASQHAHLESRADRDALAAYAQPKVIDCFVVASLRDVDEPERMRRGVHWHASARSGRSRPHYVILSTLGEPDVFSHELGHFLGNPEHSDTAGNLMSYQRGMVPPFLDASQLARLERALRGYFERGELVQAAPPSAAVGSR
jgi:hypothetical protein